MMLFELRTTRYLTTARTMSFGEKGVRDTQLDYDWH